jgi:hypothetical protein
MKFRFVYQNQGEKSTKIDEVGRCDQYVIDPDGHWIELLEWLIGHVLLIFAIPQFILEYGGFRILILPSSRVGELIPFIEK